MKKIIRTYLLGLRNRHFFIIDIVLLACLPWLALLARVDSIDQVILYRHPLAIYTFVMLAWKPLILYLSGVYERYWPFASTDSMLVLLIGTGSTILIEFVLAWFFLIQASWMAPALPRSLPVINGIITMIGVGRRPFPRSPQCGIRHGGYGREKTRPDCRGRSRGIGSRARTPSESKPEIGAGGISR